MYSGELLEIQNNTGASITYGGNSYAAGSYVILGKVITYKVAFCKLWSSDTGRSMTGENKGTLIGIFPKLSVKVGNLSEDDMSALINLLNQPSTNVKYYDAGKQTLVTASFYFGDITAELMRKKNMRHKGIEFYVIANRKRV